MTTYVMGAGASFHAKYPLVKSMGSCLFHWMKGQTAARGYASQYPATAQHMEELLGPPDNIEDMLSNAQKMRDDYENGTPEQRRIRYDLAFELPIFNNAVRGWFAEIRQQDRAHAYKRFARNIVSSDDYILTFNYDVSLDRELRLAGKLEIGDGYGFPIENFPVDSPVKMLKLHGSVSWLALMFSAIQSGNVFGLRPVIGRDDLETLVYPDAVDPKFVGDVFAHPVMIMPTRSKEFFFTVDTAAEYTEFWHEVWRQASVALQASDRIVICGYGMSSADQQARKLLLEAPRKDAEIVVASGDDTCRIVREYQEADYTRAKPAEEVMFEKWVDSCTIAAVA